MDPEMTGTGQDAEDDEDSDSDGLFVKQNYPAPVYGFVEEPEAGGDGGDRNTVGNTNADGEAFELSMESVMLGMGRLSIAVDQMALVDAFAKLRLRGKRKAVNPFVDESDEEEEDDGIR